MLAVFHVFASGSNIVGGAGVVRSSASFKPTIALSAGFPLKLMDDTCHLCALACPPKSSVESIAIGCLCPLALFSTYIPISAQFHAIRSVQKV